VITSKNIERNFGDWIIKHVFVSTCSCMHLTIVQALVSL
jgi:hypothetical protein